MLKHGPLPDGDFTYLIRDGTITKYGRWLVISTDLDLSFLDLCLLVQIMEQYVGFRDGGLPIRYILREWLFGQFCFDYKFTTVRNALTKLRDRNYIFITPLRSVSCTDEKVKEILDVMGDDFASLHDYLEEIMDVDLYAPAC